MSLALDCPHCGVQKVQTVRYAWFIQGFLLFARWGSKPYIGCDGCTRNKVIGSMVITGLAGWWCFPWGLGTPIALAQNLAAIAGGGDERELTRLLAMQGIDIDDLRLDDEGRSRGDRRLVEGVLSALHRMTWADGSADPREIEIGSEIACRMLGDLIAVDEARAILARRESPGVLDPHGLGPDAQLILLRAACAVAEADEVIEQSEVAELRALGRDLGIATDIVDKFVHALTTTAPPSTEDAEMKAIAAAVLGVDVDAPPAQVRTAYHKLAVQAGELDDAEEGAQRREQLEFAYQTLLGA